VIALIWTFYVLQVWLNVMALRQVRLTRLQFIDGLVLGLTYYITVPFCIILLYGRVGPDVFPLPDYKPYEDTTTSFVILGGSMLVSVLRIVTPLFTMRTGAGGGTNPADRTRASRRSPAARALAARHMLRYERTLLAILLVFYFGPTLAFFVASGIANGGHWYHASAALLESSLTFAYLKHLANFSRTAVFGVLAAMAVIQPHRRLGLTAIGVVIALTDLFLSFNRITVVYMMVMLLIMSWRRVGLAVAGLSAVLLSGMYLSTVWTVFRGSVSVYGYSIDGMGKALQRAIQVTGTSRPLVDQMNGMFESVSFTVLNWIVKNADTLHVGTASYFTRPLTIFIPRALWPSRPDVFATVVGTGILHSPVALNSYLFGEPFANDWLLWPILMSVAIIGYDWLFRRMANANRIWGFIGAMVAFAWWRFDSSFPAICAIVSLLIFGVLALLVPKSRVGARVAVPAGGRTSRAVS
jgi:hypothetical protein